VAETCSGRGVTNSAGVCICDLGYTGPTCSDSITSKLNSFRVVGCGAFLIMTDPLFAQMVKVGKRSLHPHVL
jgi:hypothetical protein